MLNQAELCEISPANFSQRVGRHAWADQKSTRNKWPIAILPDLLFLPEARGYMRCLEYIPL